MWDFSQWKAIFVIWWFNNLKWLKARSNKYSMTPKKTYSVDRQWRLESIHTLLLSGSIPLDLSQSIPFWVDPHPFEKKGVDRLKTSLTVHTVYIFFFLTKNIFSSYFWNKIFDLCSEKWLSWASCWGILHLYSSKVEDLGEFRESRFQKQGGKIKDFAKLFLADFWPSEPTIWPKIWPKIRSK